MLSYYEPILNKAISFDQYVLIWIKSGHGLIEVDFKTYTDFEDKLIYLSPDQYIKFIFGEFKVAKIEFPPDFVSQSKEFRVLFKHLISLGYIEFSEDNQAILHSLFSDDLLKILDVSANQWFWQNPFNAQKDEYSLIFDLKDVIDERFTEKLSIAQMISSIPTDRYQLQKLVKNRLGLTIKHLAQNKILLESQKDIAFTDKSIKEIAYDLGFKDPAYFNRFFKGNTQLSPVDFRKHFGDQHKDTFIEDLLELIHIHHKTQHTTSFYADRQSISIKAMSRKVKEKMNLSVGQLVRNEIIKSAKVMLLSLPVKEVAFELGFEEPNHFSAFFKKYTGINPSQFPQKKYNL